jgi:hypothetical protein
LLGLSADHPDAVIFAGPKTAIEGSVPQNTLNQLADVNYPVFYMTISANPRATLGGIRSALPSNI